VGSSSGRQLYTQLLYVLHVSVWALSATHQTAQTDTYTIHYNYIYSCLPDDEHTRFETCTRQQKLKLNINEESYAFSWFVLYNYITMDGEKYKRVINLTFIGPCIANIFADYNQQDATFHSLFISVRRSTCFRRFFRPSSGAQNCTYSVRPLLLPAASLAGLAAGSSIGLINTHARSR